MRVRVGQTFTLPAGDPLIMCESGFHASARPLDALGYAPGAMVCYVELVGKRIDERDKSVGRSRRVIAMADATSVLREFACCCAEVCCLEADAAAPEAWELIEATRAWSRGELSHAAWDATWDAAWADARDATWDAAWDAAWAAARPAAWVAAWDAAWAAARDTQNVNMAVTEILTNLLGVEVDVDVEKKGSRP